MVQGVRLGFWLLVVIISDVCSVQNISEPSSSDKVQASFIGRFKNDAFRGCSWDINAVLNA